MIEAVFSSTNEGDAIRRLCGDDAQTFIDVVDEVHSVPSSFHEIRLIEIDIGAFCRLGAGYTRPFTTDPKEIFKVVVRDV